MSEPTASGPITSELVAEDPSFADLVEEFIEGLDGRLQAMREAIDAQAFDTLKALSHQLKGAGGGYGYPSVSDAAAELEQRALGRDIEACQQSLDELKALVARIEVGPATTC